MRKMSLAAIAVAVLASGIATSALADSATGNIGVVSKYVLRGITGKCDKAVCSTPENDSAAVQGGLDYAHDSGFYGGYWASSLGYSDIAQPAEINTGSAGGVENDLYAGFTGGDAAAFNYKVGLIQYYYIDVDDSNLTEAVGMVAYGPVNLQAQYLLTDGAWGNQGDIYWTLNAGHEIGSKFKLGASLGYYTYNDDDH